MFTLQDLNTFTIGLPDFHNLTYKVIKSYFQKQKPIILYKILWKKLRNPANLDNIEKKFDICFSALCEHQ